MCVDCSGGFWASFCFRLVTLHSEANMKMWLFVYLYVEPVSRSKDYVRSWIKQNTQKMVLSYACAHLCRRVCLRGGHPFLRMYLWWSLCTLYLHACQVRATVGDSGLCCCACVLCMCTVWSVIQKKKHTLSDGEIRYAICRISYVAETVLVFPPFKQLAVFNQRHGVVGSVQPFVVVVPVMRLASGGWWISKAAVKHDIHLSFRHRYHLCRIVSLWHQRNCCLSIKVYKTSLWHVDET